MDLKNVTYVPDQYQSQQISYKAILENLGALKSVPDCYKTKKCVIILLMAA